ncbi:MAG: SIR2 family protein [Saprospiraceae bacterium]|nr:SIR2 family protein [Saprospiraceae bacterium]
MLNKTSATTPLENVDWDDILETLQEQRCVLFLGQGACEAPGGGDIQSALSQWLDSDNPDHPYIHVHNPDGFFLFKKRFHNRKVIAGMKQFYSRPFPEAEAQFARITRIPFSMIFSLTPDNILARTFDVMGYDYQPDFYFRKRKASEHFEKPNKQKPLIYNLLGNIEEPESLVLTHSDFFDYLESVFEANSMNQRLKDELEQMERFIFLGLPYEKWYFQLLLRVLALHTEKFKDIERFALREFENPQLQKLYTEEFKIEFFPARTPEFIGELYRQCETNGLLKPLTAPDPAEAAMPDPSPAAMKELIASAETDEALQLLKVFLARRKPRSHPLANDLVVLRNQHHLLRQRDMRGTIDSRDLSVENNQITARLLELIDQAQNL